MKTIAITGGFGTGKTTVSQMLARLGAATVDVDQISRDKTRPHQILWKKYLKLFGSQILQKDKTLNRPLIAKIVFSNPAKLKRLVSVSHPVILAEMNRQIQKLARQKKTLVVVDIPLLFEDHLESDFDFVVVVDATQPNVVKRLHSKRRLTQAQIHLRIKRQKPLSEKKKKADFVVNNNQTLQATKIQVKKLYQSLVKPLGG